MRRHIASRPRHRAPGQKPLDLAGISRRPCSLAGWYRSRISGCRAAHGTARYRRASPAGAWIGAGGGGWA